MSRYHTQGEQSIPRHAAFDSIPLSALSPTGWLRRWLEMQARGLTGHIEAAGYPFDQKAWNAKKPDEWRDVDWWIYEQTGYWIDGALRCGYLLNDPALIAKAESNATYTLDHQRKNGYLGPDALNVESTGYHRWSHAVFFRALMAYAEVHGVQKVAGALARHYLSGTCAHDYGRDICNLEAMLWAYQHTGEKRLLRMASDAWAAWNKHHPDHANSMKAMSGRKKPYEHGVTYCETMKIPALLYMHTGEASLLRASAGAFSLLDKYQMLVDGIPSSSEFLRGKDPLDSHETCDIADYTWSAGYLLQATGKVEYADKIERACFNALPGAVRSDFKGLQYFSCPNQVVADATSNHNLFYKGDKWMSYRPNPGTECCPGEVNRVIPNYVARQWMRDASGGLVAALYGPGRVTEVLGGGKEACSVSVEQETQYPFGDWIDFSLQCDAPVRFVFSLRIPAWCRSARIFINDQPQAGRLRAGTFHAIERVWQSGDRVRLVLPMPLALSRWPGGGIALERGPLVYSLPVQEEWKVDPEEVRQTPDLPAWNCYPASPWNYALLLNEKTLVHDVEIIERVSGPRPWMREETPLCLRVPARRVKRWSLIRRKSVESDRVLEVDGKVMGGIFTFKGDFCMTPPLPEVETLPERLGATTEWIELVPYGCTHLRMTVFPDGYAALN